MLKGQKGITLVALVITIIVLVILVGVTVSIVWSDDIIGESKDAVQDYNEAQLDEGRLVNNILKMIDEAKS